jgi:TolB-like protein
MTTGLLAAFCASALAIIPTLNRDRDQAARTIRGDEPSIGNVRVTPEALAAARAEFAVRSRIVVLPFAASKGDPGAELSALGCGEAMTADLHYVPGLLVLERSEVLNVIRDREPAPPAEIGRKLGVRYLITGMLTREGSGDRLDAEVIEVGPPGAEAKPVGKASASRPAGHVFELADVVLLDVLGKVKAAPAPERIAELTKVPTLSDSARALCDDGFALMDRADGLNRGDDAGLCARALKDSEAAMKADPRYLRAALLQAGCLLRLGEAERLESCLTNAYNLRIPESRIDVLTRLELDGDRAVFVKRDFESAAVQYQKMLEIDPGHLHALWMLTALHAGEYGSSRWPDYSLEKAGGYAARLIVAHPGSAAARMLGERKP